MLHGRSLGGGAVLTLLPETPVSAVVLESTFKDLRTMAHRFLLPAFLMRDPFDNLAALRGYHGPVLILHGRSDTLLPLHHGEALKAAAPSAQLVVRDCGHNDCAWDRTEFWPTITQFLNDAAK